MDISNLTIEQLKAMAYDTIGEVERAQKNLRVINDTIAKKTEMEKIALQPKTKEENKDNKSNK